MISVVPKNGNRDSAASMQLHATLCVNGQTLELKRKMKMGQELLMQVEDSKISESKIMLYALLKAVLPLFKDKDESYAFEIVIQKNLACEMHSIGSVSLEGILQRLDEVIVPPKGGKSNG